MGFFPELNVGPPSFKDDAQDSVPWEQGFGKTAFTDVLLGRSREGAVLLRSVVAYPSAVTFDVIAQLRRPLRDGPGTRGNNAPTLYLRTSDSRTGFVLFGLLLSDGSKLLNFGRDQGHEALMSIRGSGGGYQGQHVFAAPLPPAGRLEAWVAWPAADIPETLTVLDADAIRRTSEALGRPWD